MSHFNTTVIVHGPRTAQSALRQAEEMLEPYDENLRTPQVCALQPTDLTDLISKTEGLHGKELAEITADPDAHALLIATIGTHFEGDPTAGAFNDGTYGYRAAYNPEGQWDWYTVGGRWRGFYTATAATPATKYLLGDPGAFDDGKADLTGKADVIQRKNVDIAAMRAAAETAANDDYDAYENATKGLAAPEHPARALARVLLPYIEGDAAEEGTSGHNPPAPEHPGAVDDLTPAEAETWTQQALAYLRTQKNEPALKALERHRTAYRAHPWMQALHAENLVPWGTLAHDAFHVGTGGREAVVAEHRAAALMTHALLDADGWRERGQTLSFGLCADEKPLDEWAETVSATIEGLPGDAWLVLMDLHC